MPYSNQSLIKCFRSGLPPLTWILMMVNQLGLNLFLNVNLFMKYGQKTIFFIILIFYFFSSNSTISAGIDQGITDTSIRIGAIMPITGNTSYDGLDYYSINIRRGIEAALEGQVVQGRKIEFEVMNDNNDPITTVQNAREMMDKGIFIMLGNVGAVSTLKLMRVLEANQIPTMGFFILGDINADNMLNYRPNPADEVTKLVDRFVKDGIKPAQICLFAQNDIFGMAGINGLKTALKKYPDTQSEIDKLDVILDMMMGGINPALNSIGPVGFYQYETVFIREGYLSLKNWEQENRNQCKVVIMLAIPKVAADFIAYSNYKNESWSFSAISATAAGYALSNYLNMFSIDKNVVVSQVVPALDSNLPIMVDARKVLGKDLNHVSLEGYIVGRMFITILKSIKEPITRVNFVKMARQKPFDIGGLMIDFTQGNSGSSLVYLSNLKSGSYEAITKNDMSPMVKPQYSHIMNHISLSK